jgi:hypothetical protein
MIARTYIVTEGVHDVTFLGRLLIHGQSFQKAITRDQIDEGWQLWLDTFKWPSQRKKDKKTVIDRLSVPAPIFFVRREPEHVVAIANAGGVESLLETLDLHVTGFQKDGTMPQALGVVLDSDDHTPEVRFEKVAQALGEMSLPRPTAPGNVSGTPRTGIFVLPDCKSRGTLEDLLLAAGRKVYPLLHADAEAFVRTSIGRHGELNAKESASIGNVAGPKKATIQP